MRASESLSAPSTDRRESLAGPESDPSDSSDPFAILNDASSVLFLRGCENANHEVKRASGEGAAKSGPGAVTADKAGSERGGADPGVPGVPLVVVVAAGVGAAAVALVRAAATAGIRGGFPCPAAPSPSLPIVVATAAGALSGARTASNLQLSGVLNTHASRSERVVGAQYNNRTPEGPFTRIKSRSSDRSRNMAGTEPPRFITEPNFSTSSPSCRNVLQ
jgi:hypothetical protein